jgi:radical SAM protein with 4Fe4S-binding SPASM domain
MTESVIKPVNCLKSGYSFLHSSLSGKAVIKGMPVSVSAELTNNCNLNCPQCSSGSGRMLRSRGFMDIDLFKKLIQELDPYLYNVNLYFQGEPMLHPSFFSFLSNCLNINSVVSTNGHFLSEEASERIVGSGLNKLIISLDGTDKETYSEYRVNGDLEKVIDGIRNISAAKKKYKSSLKIELQFLVNKFNQHQVRAIRQLAESFQVKLKLKSMQIIDKADIDSWMPSARRFRRYRLSKGIYELKSSLPDRCGRLWFNPVVTWDGKIVPCCFDKDAEYVMGDLNQESFRNIWEGPGYMEFRNGILTGRNKIEMCRNCTSGLRGVRY